MKKLMSTYIVLIGTLFLSACTSVYDKHVSWQPVKPESFPIVTAVGYAPISLQNSEHETQRMLMAIKASKLAAYAELAEQVYGQQIASNMTMADLLIENSQLKASVQGVIRGAKVMKSYPVGDTYATELTIDFKEVYEIYVASMRKQEIKEVTYY
ncbi:flagellar biosynthesis protein FlgP [Thalassotalea sp. M1531]|uniref:Flagellar biosynthesis protein FlgP n=1 Tax=Thalassotalea algicola TaxID=2716224 RepID=A0A7Y0LEF1_9GAMM|nr:LPP20 family lipoprotein [Thalassotalea algicola]NMP33013.1 flagellar biosynthesis protein FlgP [Thalassotalea algicola]